MFHTEVYSKPTHAYQYLKFKSCHPPHVKRAIPYSQGLRLRRICNSDNVFEEKLGELKGFLVKRAYCSDYVNNQFERMRGVYRNTLLKRKEGIESRNRNCFVVDYHPALRILYVIVQIQEKDFKYEEFVPVRGETSDWNGLQVFEIPVKSSVEYLN